MTNSEYVTIKQLADGVWASSSKEGHKAGFVDLGDKTIVFDTFLSTAAAADMCSAAEQLTGRPVSVVVNSHFHRDHVSGNSVFPEDAIIISTSRTRELINDPEVRLPNLTFNGRMVFHGERRRAELMAFGVAGHTEGDAVLWLPDAKVIFVGDLLFHEFHFLMGDGDPDGCLQILDELEALQPDIIVSGHCEVSTPTTFDATRQYISVTRKFATDLFEKGVSLDDAVASEVPAELAMLKWPAGFSHNIRFFYERLSAESEAG